jgi:excisionase family DNA binding protein
LTRSKSNAAGDPLPAVLSGEPALASQTSPAVVQPPPVAAGAGTEESDPELLTPEQAAKALSISGRTLCRLTARGDLPHVRLGKRLVRYPRKALADWIEARTCRGKSRRN